MYVGFEKIICKSFVGRQGRRCLLKRCISSTDYGNSRVHKFKSQVGAFHFSNFNCVNSAFRLSLCDRAWKQYVTLVWSVDASF